MIKYFFCLLCLQDRVRGGGGGLMEMDGAVMPSTAGGGYIRPQVCYTFLMGLLALRPIRSNSERYLST